MNYLEGEEFVLVKENENRVTMSEEDINAKYKRGD